MGAVALAAFVGVGAGPAPARAFCGFMVGGGEAQLTNQGSMVVLMRDGTRTVIAMQNDYQGPPEDFALVVPVPEVLEEGQVKTLPREVFARVDQLAAPRLVEYWEQDPCPQPALYEPEREELLRAQPTSVQEGADDDWEEPEDLGVTVEAEFEVGEYDIVILGAEDSAGLDTWLRRSGYRIPDGAERVLRAYVEQSMKFFVAKVSAERVTWETGADGREKAVLSPLRFHYDSESFFLPVRLGLLNADGDQDVIVHVLARQLRYEVANYDNYAVPTNLRVSDEVRESFPAFYEALYARMLEAHPRAVLTEYAWSAGSCDPCPGPTLTADELVTLGADVIPSYERAVRRGRVQTGFERDFVLTRLHFRTPAGRAPEAVEDLFFRPAPAIEGGRGQPGTDGTMSRGVRAYAVNNFQARYAVLHEWEGPIECEEPMRGRWGGPPSTQRGSSGPMAAAGLAFASSAGSESLEAYLTQDVPELGRASDTLPSGPTEAPPPPPPPPGSGCARCAAGGGGAVPSLLGLVALALLLRRRRA
ncbi:MAG: hypothetical protein CMN29_15710 [Sandaracinus sp.]|nr:hypothetical protein [Myxococcales bacterium]MAT26385.1 hypothetical protein [Sandaracinus sp.]